MPVTFVIYLTQKRDIEENAFAVRRHSSSTGLGNLPSRTLQLNN